MEKINSKTPSIGQKLIEELAKIAPNCITEAKDQQGNNCKVVNMSMLEQMLSDTVLTQHEMYEFTWVGKRASIVEANKATSKTLRPIKSDSIKWDKTENLYIEGDNLEALKIMQESYLGRIKMIYIDPPYNTGNDSFVYNDNYNMDEDEYKEGINLYDEDNNILFKENNDSNPRFHSDWCSMLYSRLIIARNLLTEDGAIFYSIDDNEVDNAIKLGNEVFGEDNFINIITIKTKIGGVSGSSEGKSLKDATEFICVYAKNKSKVLFNSVYIKQKLFSRIKSYEEEGKSWKYTSIVTKLGDKELILDDKERGMKFYGYKTLETMSLSSFAQKEGISIEDVYNTFADKIFQTTNAQSSVRQTVIKLMAPFQYPMIGLEYKPTKGKNEGETIEVLYKGNQRRMMMFLSDAVTKINSEYYYLDKITTLWDDIQYNNLSKEGDIEYPNGKKPIKLIQRLIEMATDENSIVMDFFSGSASTAHAVMKENVETGGKRSFIMVQLPEAIDKDSEFGKKGFRTICDIGKERIRRAAKMIHEEYPNVTFDDGFRVFKVDSSNMNDVSYSASDMTQDLLSKTTSNIKADRSDLDLLFDCLLKEGVEITYPYSSETIDGCTVHDYNNGALIACFDEDVTETVMREMAKRKPIRAIFRDSSFKTDADRINVEELFKLISPDTTVKVI